MRTTPLLVIVGALLAGHALAQPLKAQRGLGQAGAPPAATSVGATPVGDIDGDIYRASYRAISTPEQAREFIDRYRDNDPEGLTATAMRRGYERGIAEAKACIEFSQRTIAAEQEIGRTVGVVDKAALHQAGRNLLVCRKDLARYQSEEAKRK